MRLLRSAALISVGIFFVQSTGFALSSQIFAQSYGDVTVKKNADGSIETYDSSDVPSRSAPSRRSRSGYKHSTQHYGDGVVVRKNADGSIETFDSDDVTPSPRRSSVRRSSSRSVNKYRDGVVVRKNPDGSIETFDTSDSAPSGWHGSSGGVHKPVHKYSHGVTVKHHPDGTIESFDSAPAGKKARSVSKSTAVGKASSSAKNTAPAKKTAHCSAHRTHARGNYGGVTVRRNPDGSIETFDSN